MEKKGDSDYEEEKKASGSLEQDVLEVATIEEINKARYEHAFDKYGQSLRVCRILLELKDAEDGQNFPGVGSGFIYKIIQVQSTAQKFGIVLTAAHLFVDSQYTFEECCAAIRVYGEVKNPYKVLKIYIPEEYTQAQTSENDYAFLIVDLSRLPLEILAGVGWDFGFNFDPKFEFILRNMDEAIVQLTMVCPFILDMNSTTKLLEGDEELRGTLKPPPFSNIPDAWNNIKEITYDIPSVQGHSGAIVGIVKKKNEFVPIAVHSRGSRTAAQGLLKNHGRLIDKTVTNLGRYVEEEILRCFDNISFYRNRLVAIKFEETKQSSVEKEVKELVKASEQVLAKGDWVVKSQH